MSHTENRGVLQTMLSLQTSHLEQQERLFRNQIRLGLRQILNEELAFYNNAFNNISATSSVLAGFAFVGLQMDIYEEHQPGTLRMFNILSAASTCICLLTTLLANFSALFSSRLALRGGESAVEEAVVKVRAEYKLCLMCLMAGVESFVVMIAVLGYYKFDDLTATLITIIIVVPSFILVLYSYQRISVKFHLSRESRFASTASLQQEHGGNQAHAKDVEGGHHHKQERSSVLPHGLARVLGGSGSMQHGPQPQPPTSHLEQLAGGVDQRNMVDRDQSSSTLPDTLRRNADFIPQQHSGLHRANGELGATSHAAAAAAPPAAPEYRRTPQSAAAAMAVHNPAHLQTSTAHKRGPWAQRLGLVPPKNA